MSEQQHKYLMGTDMATENSPVRPFLMVDINALQSIGYTPEKFIEEWKQTTGWGIIRSEPLLQKLTDEEATEKITEIMREADQLFQTTGGGTRHYVRDIMLPLLQKAGLCFCREVKSTPKTTDNG